MNAQNQYGETALIAAINKKYEQYPRKRNKIVKMLIKAGADVNIIGKDSEISSSPYNKRTPLMIAVAKEYPESTQIEDNFTIEIEIGSELVKNLLDAGADVNAKDEDGWTPLMIAANLDKPNAGIINMLLDAGANPNVDVEGLRAIDYLRANEIFNDDSTLERLEKMTDKPSSERRIGINELSKQIYRGSVKGVKMLLDAGVNPDIREKETDWTPLMDAVRQGEDHIARLLIEAGADVNATAASHETALKKALYNDPVDLEIMRILLEAGADINAADSYDVTPLIYAAKKCDSSVIEFLLEYGADPNIERKKLKAFDYAQSNPLLKNTKTLKELGKVTAPRGSDWGTSDEAFLEICEVGYFPDIMTAIENGANINAKNTQEETLLMKMMNVESPFEQVKYIIDKGADVNTGTDSIGGNALMRAVSRHEINFENSTKPDIKIIKLLIDSGADVNIKDSGGDTPLIYAAYDSDPEIIKFLLAQGADINVQDDEGITALMKAIQYNLSVEVTRVLIDAGADIELRDKNGKCAFDYLELRKCIRPTPIDDALIERLRPKNI